MSTEESLQTTGTIEEGESILLIRSANEFTQLISNLLKTIYTKWQAVDIFHFEKQKQELDAHRPFPPQAFKSLKEKLEVDEGAQFYRNRRELAYFRRNCACLAKRADSVRKTAQRSSGNKRI